jgi:putative copper export protein
VETAIAAVHVLAACVWVGGTVALVFAAVPVLRRAEGAERAEAMRALGRRWRPLGWGAMAVAILTGLLLAEDAGALHRESLDTRFDRILIVKAALIALLIAGSLVHNLVLGPKLQRELREGLPQRTRPRMVAVGWTNFALTIAVPVLGVVMSRL